MLRQVSFGRCFAAFLLVSVAPLFAGGLELSGRVVDENEVPVRDARITVRAAGNGPARFWEVATDADGKFRIELPGSGDYLVSVQREGYYPLANRPVHPETLQELTLIINTVREVFQSLNVAETPSPVDLNRPANAERLSGTEINDVPYANSHSLRNALALMPGVVEDSAGALHVNGSQENQVQYLLNGFDISNPVSGQLQSVFAVEGVRSVDLETGRFSAEYGKGSAGAMAINVESGTDTFHYTATDFIPGLSLQKGLHLGNWYPRFGVSGPILRGKAWFSDTFDGQYNETIVNGLPTGQDTRSGIAIGNLLHAQANLSASNILFGDFLINVDHEGRVGLGPLNPVPTTSTVHTHEYFTSVKDQAYLGRGVLVEFGYSQNEFFNSQTPQGSALYVFSPLGQSGNYFVNAQQTSSREEGTVHVYFPQIEWAGAHRIETGGDADLRREHGDFNRTGYQVLGPTGQLLSETVFPAPAMFHVQDVASSWYLTDAWRVSKRVQFDLGLRGDFDQRMSPGWSPRAAVSWSPFASNKTRVAAGYAITHDQVTLDALSRPLDQIAETTQYTANGSPAGPATATSFQIAGPLALPRAVNWTASVDHQVSRTIFAGVKYLRRRGTDGFVWINTLAPDALPSLLPLPGGESGGLFTLTNLRRDDYDSVQVSVRQSFAGQHEWMASYTRSRAATNALIDSNSPQPLQLLPGFVPMPWDAPNRFLAWGYLPVPWKRMSRNWSIAVLADMRSGYPFSVRQPDGTVAGTVDSYRYPLNFDLDIAIERIVTLRGYRFAVRLGMDNITNQANPTAVNNVTGVPQFLEFLGDEGRHAVVRIRFFGRATAH